MKDARLIQMSLIDYFQASGYIIKVYENSTSWKIEALAYLEHLNDDWSHFNIVFTFKIPFDFDSGLVLDDYDLDISDLLSINVSEISKIEGECQFRLHSKISKWAELQTWGEIESVLIKDIKSAKKFIKSSVNFIIENKNSSDIEIKKVNTTTKHYSNVTPIWSRQL